MSRSKYTVPLWNRLGRILIIPVFKLAFRLLYRPWVTGLENIPAAGPYMLVYNHVSIVDPPFVICSLRELPEVLGAVDIWYKPWQNLLAWIYGAIPIHRGEVDRQAMEKMLAALRNGRALLVAPEGGRSHVPGLRRAKSGVVYLIEQTRIPIVPIGIIGTTDADLKRALRGERPDLGMRVGKPFFLPETSLSGQSPKEVRQAKADYIMAKLAELLPEEYHGVYAKSAADKANLVQTLE